MRRLVRPFDLARAASALLAAATPLAVRAQTPVVVRRDSVVIIRGGGRLPADSIKLLVRSLQDAEFGSREWIVMSHRLDSLLRGGVVVRGFVPTRGAMTRGWIGFDAQGPMQMLVKPSGQFLTYFAYPSIISVEPESPAGRAGIAPGDVLVAYNGIDVVGHAFNLSELFVPDRKLDVRVRRGGEPYDYTLTIVKAPERIAMRMLAFSDKLQALEGPDVPRPPVSQELLLPRAGRVVRMPMLPGNIFIIGRDGVLGANMSTVGPELAQVLKLSGTGVLVNQMIDNSPAAQSGLRVGDLIVSVDSKPVSTLEELRAIVQANMDTHEIPLRVVRDHKARDIILKW